MENLLEFDIFNPQAPGAAPAGSEVAPPVFGTVDFSMSGVSDDAMKLIAGLMAQAVLSSGEAEKITRMADTDPRSAASYLQKKVEGILADVPGLNPTFIQGMKSQSANIAKTMVESIPGLLGSLTDKDIETNELKPDTAKSSFLTKLSGFFSDNQGA